MRMLSTVWIVPLVVLLILVLPATAQDLQKGLIAYWSFDGDATDRSGNGYDAAENGDVTYVAGRFGDALSLEADGAYLEVANSEDLKLMGPFTVSAHLKPSNLDHGDILYHGLGCSTWSSWFLGMQGGEPDATLVPNSYVFGVRTANGGGYTGVSADAAAGEWVYVAAVYDGSNVTMYVDGEEKDSIATNPPWNSAENLYIGGDPGCGGRSWYTGLLDEVRIYNRALDMGELSQLMAGGLAVEPAGKLATRWAAIKRTF